MLYHLKRVSHETVHFNGLILSFPMSKSDNYLALVKKDG